MPPPPTLWTKFSDPQFWRDFCQIMLKSARGKILFCKKGGGGMLIHVKEDVGMYLGAWCWKI